MKTHPRKTSWQRTLWILFTTQMVSSIGFSSIFPFLPLYVKSLGTVTRIPLELLAGMVFSSQAVTMMIASPFWGTLADRHGRKLMVVRAMFGGAFVLVLMAFVRNAEELVFLRGVQGLISGTIGATNALVAAVTPRERMGYAMGVLQVGIGLGVALGPLIGGAVADAFGYASAFYVTGGLLVMAGIMVIYCVQEDFSTPSPSGKSSRATHWREILASSGVMVTYSLRFLNQSGRMIFVPILPLFIQSLMEESASVNTLTGVATGCTAATATLSSIYLGRLGDRTSHRRIIIVCSSCGAVLFILQSLATHWWQLVVLQALIGISIGGIVPGISALLARCTRAGTEGAVYGLDNSITSAARALSPMAGVAISMWFNIRSVFAAGALLYGLGALMAVWGLPTGSRPGRQVPKISPPTN